MSPEELLRQGRLDECLAATEAQVRKNIKDPKSRILLFQVLAVLGDWDRARTQLDTAAQMDPQAALMAKACNQAILLERVRMDVFAGKRTPLVLGEPEEWLGWLVQAAALSGQGKHDAAADLRSRAFEAAPTTSGFIDSGASEDAILTNTFEWIADADERLGPVLEAYIDGKYYWIPWHRIALLHVERPADLRDMVWCPVQIVLTAGGQKEGFVPTRYPGTEAKGVDGLLKLSRRTEFVSQGGVEVPLGQRMLATDQGEFGLLECRRIRTGDGTATLDPGPSLAAAGLKLDASMKPGAPGANGVGHG